MKYGFHFMTSLCIDLEKAGDPADRNSYGHAIGKPQPAGLAGEALIFGRSQTGTNNLETFNRRAFAPVDNVI
ncbi:hypothetical protein BBL07_13525 [Agrobacterium vitis]|nr:hypothetical protein BBL07_13525 [Agrobacterium vitis]